MFERFTNDARGVLVQAQEEARALGHHPHIGTEHLLLALTVDRGGVAARVLQSMGILRQTVLEKVEELVPARPDAKVNLPFSPNAKFAMEGALREARALGHNYIGTEHLLLGIMRVPDCAGFRVLQLLGVSPDRLRQEVLSVLSDGLEMAAEDVPGGSGVGEHVHGSVRLGPLCPTCRTTVDSMTYRVATAVPASDQAGEALAPVEVMLVCCPRCGRVIGVLPKPTG